jgi:hypothetical protein
MTDKPKNRQRRRLVWTLILVIMLSYPLSIGPTVHYALGKADLDSGIKTVGMVYRPIWWLRDHSQFAQFVIDRYIRLFNADWLRLHKSCQSCTKTPAKTAFLCKATHREQNRHPRRRSRSIIIEHVRRDLLCCRLQRYA